MNTVHWPRYEYALSEISAKASKDTDKKKFKIVLLYSVIVNNGLTDVLELPQTHKWEMTWIVKRERKKTAQYFIKCGSQMSLKVLFCLKLPKSVCAFYVFFSRLHIRFILISCSLIVAICLSQWWSINDIFSLLFIYWCWTCVHQHLSNIFH